MGDKIGRKSDLKGKREQFGVSFNRITMDETGRLDSTAKLLYIVLDTFCYNEKDSCFPGIERLGKILGCKRDKVMSSMKKLKEFGLVQVERRGFQQTNVYTLNDPNSAKIKKLFPYKEVDINV